MGGRAVNTIPFAGNKPACLSQVLNFPLASGYQKPSAEWFFNYLLRGFLDD
jgi:hypothetical protein